MKHLVFLFALCFFCGFAQQMHAQPFLEVGEQIIYYDENGIVSSEDDALYYRIVELDENRKAKKRFLTYHITGEIFSSSDGADFIDAKDDRLSRFTGTSYYYNKSGWIEATYYRNDKGVVNEVKFWHPNGNVKDQFGVLNGKINGIRTTYYENGKLESEDTYNEGIGTDQWYAYCDEDGECNRIFFENFSDKNNPNKWNPIKKECCNTTFSGEGYLMESKNEPGYKETIPLMIDAKGDFSIQSTFKSESGAIGNGAGLIWAFNSWSNYNYFIIKTESYKSDNGNTHQRGFYQIGIVKDGKYLEPADWKPLNFVLEENRLAISKFDDKVHFYCNKKYLETQSYHPFMGFDLGFIVKGAGQKVRFKNLTVTENTSPPDEPKKEVTRAVPSTIANQKKYNFYRGNIVKINPYDNPGQKWPVFASLHNTRLMYMDKLPENRHLVLNVNGNLFAWAKVFDKVFDFKRNNFNAKVSVNGNGGFLFGNILVFFNNVTGEFRIAEFIQTEKYWKTIQKGNLKDYIIDNKIYKPYPAYPCEVCRGWFDLEVIKSGKKTEVFLRGREVSFKVFESNSVPYSDEPSEFGLGATNGVTRFEDYFFENSDGYALGNCKEYVAICPNDKQAVLDENGFFLTECNFQYINCFYDGLYSVAKIAYDKPDVIIDRGGNFITGNFTLNVTDPNFGENKKAEKFTCKITLEKGVPTGVFSCSYENGKPYFEFKLKNGEYVKDSAKFFAKFGVALDTPDNFEDFDFYELIVNGLDDLYKDEVEMIGRAE